MHTLQKLLITRLINENGQKFSELTRGYDSDDNIVFHIKKLIDKGYVEKRDNQYFITSEGIKTVNSFYKVTLKENVFKMVYVGFICEHNKRFLLKYHTNTKIPFYNLPGGIPLFGESMQKALPRIFRLETGVDIDYDRFEFDSLHMKTVKSRAGEVLFDDGFIVYKVSVSQQERDDIMSDKNLVWKSKNEITKLTEKWPEIDICILKKDWKTYNEYEVVSDYHLK